MQDNDEISYEEYDTIDTTGKISVYKKEEIEDDIEDQKAKYGLSKPRRIVMKANIVK